MKNLGKWQWATIYLAIIVAVLATFSVTIYQRSQRYAATISSQSQALLTAAEASVDGLADNPKLNHLTISALDELVQSGQDIIIYFERSGCGDCSLFNPQFDTYLDEHEVPEIYSVELQTFRDSASPEEWAAFKAKYGFDETPAFVRYKDGQKVSIVQQQTGVQVLTVDLVDTWLKAQTAGA